MLQENPETITCIPVNHCMNAITQELQMVPEWIIQEYIDNRISFCEGLLNNLESHPQRDKELIGELQKNYVYLLEERTKFYANQTLQS